MTESQRLYHREYQKKLRADPVTGDLLRKKVNERLKLKRSLMSDGELLELRAKKNALNARYRERHRKEINARQNARYALRNRDEREKIWKDAYERAKLNPEFMKKRNQYKRKWKQENAAKVIASNANRRSIILRRMPPWVNINEIRRIYEECKKISLETGVLHHVDHIIPLCGKIVSGLHVPWNLQIIPACENLKKNNRFVEV